jgi:hypothetical protein
MTSTLGQGSSFFFTVRLGVPVQHRNATSVTIAPRELPANGVMNCRSGGAGDCIVSVVLRIRLELVEEVKCFLRPSLFVPFPSAGLNVSFEFIIEWICYSR